MVDLSSYLVSENSPVVLNRRVQNMTSEFFIFLFSWYLRGTEAVQRQWKVCVELSPWPHPCLLFNNVLPEHSWSFFFPIIYFWVFSTWARSGITVISHSRLVCRLHKWHEFEVDLSAELDNFTGFLKSVSTALKLLHHSKIVFVWFKLFDLLRETIWGQKNGWKIWFSPDDCVLCL